MKDGGDKWLIKFIDLISLIHKSYTLLVSPRDMHMFFFMDFVIIQNSLILDIIQHVYLLSFNFLPYLVKFFTNGLRFQGALTQILKHTKEDFFSKIINILREASDILYDRIKEIPCLICPHKPEGSMVAMVRMCIETMRLVVLQHKHLKIKLN